jgi:hypothetical protein
MSVQLLGFIVAAEFGIPLPGHIYLLRRVRPMLYVTGKLRRRGAEGNTFRRPAITIMGSTLPNKNVQATLFQIPPPLRISAAVLALIFI